MQLKAEFVEFIPDRLEHGTLYISRRYSMATHLCCCGCGQEVVTPLKPAKWRLHERNGAVWLSPSIGNWSFPCQSHYWIEGNRVRWAAELSSAAIAQVRAQDHYDAEQAHRRDLIAIMRDWITAAWRAPRARSHASGTDRLHVINKFPWITVHFPLLDVSFAMEHRRIGLTLEPVVDLSRTNGDVPGTGFEQPNDQIELTCFREKC
jgi:Family of unknown function (DUF6527)